MAISTPTSPTLLPFQSQGPAASCEDNSLARSLASLKELGLPKEEFNKLAKEMQNTSETTAQTLAGLKKVSGAGFKKALAAKLAARKLRKKQASANNPDATRSKQRPEAPQAEEKQPPKVEAPREKAIAPLSEEPPLSEESPLLNQPPVASSAAAGANTAITPQPQGLPEGDDNPAPDNKIFIQIDNSDDESEVEATPDASRSPAEVAATALFFVALGAVAWRFFKK
jgi:hypothetical protein